MGFTHLILYLHTSNLYSNFYTLLKLSNLTQPGVTSISSIQNQSFFIEKLYVFNGHHKNIFTRHHKGISSCYSYKKSVNRNCHCQYNNLTLTKTRNIQQYLLIPSSQGLNCYYIGDKYQCFGLG